MGYGTTLKTFPRVLATELIPSASTYGSPSEHVLNSNAPFRVGAAELGNWNAKGFPKDDPFMIRNFGGAIDEFCLFGRALGAEEIRALYSAGKPQSDSLIQTGN